MNTEQLMKTLSEIDGSYIEAADPERGIKLHSGRRWAAVAAGLVVLIGSAALLARTVGHRPTPAEPAPNDIQLSGTEPSGTTTPSAATETTAPTAEATDSEWDTPPSEAELSQLSKITLPEACFDGFGYESYMVYSVEELENGNPWRADNSPRYLPVYRNLVYDRVGTGGLNQEELQARLNDLLYRSAGLIEPNLTAQPSYQTIDFGNHSETTLYAINAEGENSTVELTRDGTVSIDYPEGQSLPESYVFRSDSSEEEAEVVLEYLAETYGQALGIQHPKIALQGDRTYYGKKNYWFFIYEDSPHLEQAILNYAFHSVQFYPSEDGKLSTIRIYDEDAKVENLGTYPIISPEAATELLRTGHYATSVPVAYTGTEEIAKVELVYRTGIRAQVLLPYYRFYIDVTGKEDAGVSLSYGLREYGAYYVPAVEPAYIENLPTYDGSFN